MLIRVVVYGLLFLGLFFGYVKFLERNSVFFPSREFIGTPEVLRLRYREYIFPSSDNVTLHAWFVPAQNSPVTFFLCHGNAGNISHRLDKIKTLNEIGANVFIFDYRGYGKSEGGSLCEKTVYEDAESAYRYLTGELGIDEKDVIIHGTSLGGAVAIELAQRVAARGLVVESSFTRARDMAKEMYPFIPPVLFPNMFDSLGKIENVRMPKLFFHSRQDEVVSFTMGEKLYNAALGDKRLIEIGGGHDLGFLESQDTYKKALRDFIEHLYHRT